MKKLTKVDGESQNIVNENIKALKPIIPSAFSEDQIDFDVLRQSLGETITSNEEKYGLNWYGKSKARQIALSSSLGTLRPCPKESVGWDTTQNVFIEGDNLEVLKLLQKSYAGKVKLIYIDPPYNTEGDFIYPDRFQDNLDSYLLYTGQVNEDGLKNSSDVEVNGRKHTNWLNMMFPRLKLARSLLSDTGLILCHIDEHEIMNLHHIFDEIFGPENNLGPIIWDKRNPKGNVKNISTQHEYIAIYAKNAERLYDINPLKKQKANAQAMIEKATQLFSKIGKSYIPEDLKAAIKKYNLPIDEKKFKQDFDLDAVNQEYQNWLCKQSFSGGESAYKYIDSDGEVYQSVSMAYPGKDHAPADYCKPLIHPITNKECPIPAKGWRNPQSTMAELMKKNQIIFGTDETTQPRRKYILSENMDENIPSILPFGGSDDELLNKLEIPFDNPKPVKFAKSLLSYFLSDGDIFVDFFAGSATAAHASMELCAEKEISLKYILVQLPEHLDSSKKEQRVAANFCESIGKPLNISEIGKERIRRSVAKVKDEYPDYRGDLGFKVFKLDSSNIRAWNPYNTELEQTLHDSIEHIVTGRDEQDILYELLLKRGLDLTVSIETRKISDKTVYSISNGLLFACLDETVNEDEIENLGLGITNWHKELGNLPETQVIFRDSAFAGDVSKTNMVAILEQNGIAQVRSL